MKKLISLYTLGLLFITAVLSQGLNAAEYSSAAHQHMKDPQLPKVIILLGAPGSGKGTQAVKLSEELKIPHISTGDIFRDNVKNETKLGKKAKSYMDAGKLVPDSLVTELLKDRLTNPDTAHGYILDGYPRTVAQAKEFDHIIGSDAKIIAIYLDVHDDIIMQRIAKRAKETGGSRSDDSPQIAKKRLKIYHEQTAPVMDYYKKKGQLTRIDAEQGLEESYEEILSVYRK